MTPISWSSPKLMDNVIASNRLPRSSMRKLPLLIQFMPRSLMARLSRQTTHACKEWRESVVSALPSHNSKR